MCLYLCTICTHAQAELIHNHRYIYTYMHIWSRLDLLPLPHVLFPTNNSVIECILTEMEQISDDNQSETQHQSDASYIPADLEMSQV